MFTEEYKKSMIKLIEWYRDKYHQTDSGHNEMIETIKSANDEKELSIIERIIDDWI